ncbi:MAG: Uma2 family endonuclease [Xenococcaceae cyanobacterium]
MTTTIIPPPPEKYPLAQPVLLKNISWQTYESLLKDLEKQPAIRLTYDRGLLQIMTPLKPHEGYKKIIGRFVETITEELDSDVCSLGSLTCKREDLARGFEPDQCYYIKNEELVWDKEKINLDEDPPPDLVIEIDITSSSINQFDLYAAFGVPEVWRYDGKILKFYGLEDKLYVECDRSVAFPFLAPSEIVRFLELRKSTKETPLIKKFREWVRSKISKLK